MKRRNVLMGALAALPLPGAAVLPNGTMGEAKAKVTHEPFGDLRIYYDGPTEQLKQITAGSLRLNPGASPHEPFPVPRVRPVWRKLEIARA